MRSLLLFIFKIARNAKLLFASVYVVDFSSFHSTDFLAGFIT